MKNTDAAPLYLLFNEATRALNGANERVFVRGKIGEVLGALVRSDQRGALPADDGNGNPTEVAMKTLIDFYVTLRAREAERGQAFAAAVNPKEIVISGAGPVGLAAALEAWR